MNKQAFLHGYHYQMQKSSAWLSDDILSVAIPGVAAALAGGAYGVINAPITGDPYQDALIMAAGSGAAGAGLGYGGKALYDHWYGKTSIPNKTTPVAPNEPAKTKVISHEPAKTKVISPEREKENWNTLKDSVTNLANNAKDSKLVSQMTHGGQHILHGIEDYATRAVNTLTSPIANLNSREIIRTLDKHLLTPFSRGLDRYFYTEYPTLYKKVDNFRINTIKPFFN